MACVNNANPDQTVPEGVVRSGYHSLQFNQEFCERNAQGNKI